MTDSSSSPRESETRRGERIRRTDMPDGIVRLTFDRPDSAANVFDRATIGELELRLEAIAADKDVRGVLFDSAKPSIFIAGADLEELSALTDPDDIRAAVERGQRVFDRIAKLPCTTVAAIHGACLGGGFELALACDARIASDDRATKIGLPEVMLGILPAWGGSTRLPRLIGMPQALAAILQGRQHPAKLAKIRGLVDRVVPKEHLHRLAIDLLRTGPPKRKSIRLAHLKPIAKFIAKKATDQVLATTGGHYPAPLRVIEVVRDGLAVSEAESQKLEADAAVDLIRTDVSKQLIRVFFLQERAKKCSVLPQGAPTPEPERVDRMVVLGAGVMGAGIAQWSSARGIEVILRDLDPERVRAGMQTIASTYKSAVKKRKLDRVAAQAGLDRVFPSAIDVPFGDVDLVVEAAVEKMDVKRTIFADLDEAARPAAILATNTSSLSVSDVAEGLDHPQRVVGIHFFNPVARMQLVEVVRGKATSNEVLERAVRYVHQIGKLPVVVADAPGFVVNRILMPYLFEAVHLFENGAAIESVDRAMTQFGMPMGPLRLLDEVGLDVAAHVGDHVGPIFGDRLPTCPSMQAMVDAGWLGRKAGRGFYVYSKKKTKKDPKPNGALDRHVTSKSAVTLPVDELARRMTLLMINEAARCLEENVVEDPRDVDFAMIMGTGFAPFRGGPLRHADAIGVATAVEALRRLSNEVSARFEPCDTLVRMAKESRSFYPSDS